MPPPRHIVPSYLRHPYGRAYLYARTANGRRMQVFLGDHATPESLTEYRRVLAQIEAGRPPVREPVGVLVKELADGFLVHADFYYCDREGKRTPEYGNFRSAVAVCGADEAATFGPVALKAVRNAMVAKGWSRGS